MRKQLLCLFCAIHLLLFSGCTKVSEEVTKHSEQVSDVFAKGDIKLINEIIFGANQFTVDDELSSVWGESEGKETGILEYIFQYVSVSVKKITGEEIEYIVEAPDMSDLFTDSNNLRSIKSKESLEAYIKEYADKADRIVTTVAVPYQIQNENPIIDYTDEAFVNAITGGLVDAYKRLYSAMLNNIANEKGG